MGTGIIICGLNGAGKSTIGKALAKKLNFYFIDSEDLYFPNKDSDYSSPSSHKDAAELFFQKISAHENFIYTSVKGAFGKDSYPFFQYAVLVDVPKDIRLQRIKKRSFEKFGNRILSGGDLHEQEENFFDFVAARSENTVEEWIPSLNCPVIRIDGTKSVEENINFIIKQLNFFTHLI